MLSSNRRCSRKPRRHRWLKYPSLRACPILPLPHPFSHRPPVIGLEHHSKPSRRLPPRLPGCRPSRRCRALIRAKCRFSLHRPVDYSCHRTRSARWPRSPNPNRRRPPSAFTTGYRRRRRRIRRHRRARASMIRRIRRMPRPTCGPSIRARPRSARPTPATAPAPPCPPKHPTPPPPSPTCRRADFGGRTRASGAMRRHGGPRRRSVHRAAVVLPAVIDSRARPRPRTAANPINLKRGLRPVRRRSVAVVLPKRNWTGRPDGKGLGGRDLFTVASDRRARGREPTGSR